MNEHDEQILWRAVSVLETESYISRLTELTGQPLAAMIKRLPKAVNEQLHRVVQGALYKSLDLALYKMDQGMAEPSRLGFKVLTCVSGGVSGFFGLTTLAVELPISTGLMLRSIAGIARRQGENLDNVATRLACLEVLALTPGARGKGTAEATLMSETGYYAARTILARAVSDAAQTVAQRGVTSGAASAVVELVSTVGSRFGVVVSDKLAAGAVPVVGAIGGAAVNLAFMQHFQQLADAHFAVRRLERIYGIGEVQQAYERYCFEVRERVAREAQKVS